MTRARLKPDPVVEDLSALEAKVRALFASWAERGRTGPKRWLLNASDLDWPELQELTRSIVEDPGWRIHVADRGTAWERVWLYLLAPSLVFKTCHRSRSETCPMIGFLPVAMDDAIEAAAKARHKLRPDASIKHSDDVIFEVRAHQNRILDGLKGGQG